MAEERDGNYFRYLRYLRMSREAHGRFSFINGREHGLVWPNARLAIGYASISDVGAAEVALAEAARRNGSDDLNPTNLVFTYALAKAVLLDATGRHGEAEAVARKIIAMFVADREGAQ